MQTNGLAFKGTQLTVALRQSADQGGNIQVHDDKGVLYQLCGLGPNCAIDRGKPSRRRAFLLKREGLELALYSLHYLGVKQVVVLLPPPPGRAQTVAMYFRQGDVASQLDRPLTASLTPRAPTVKTVTKSPDAGLVQQRTSTELPVQPDGLELQRPGLPGPRPLQRRRRRQAAEGARQAGEGRGRRHRDDRLGRVRSAAERAALAQARARLDTLDFFPRPVRMRFVRLLSTPWLFRLPWFRRFDGYTMWDLILLRGPVEQAPGDLVVHELCHVWQMQHHPIAMPLSYLTQGYADNPNEVQARRAASLTS